MSPPRYEKYKNSDVDWLGSIPLHWQTSRLKNLFSIKKRIAGTEGFDVLSITQHGLKVKDISSNDGQLSMDYSKYQLVYPGDFAMNHMDLLTGYADISKHTGVTSPDYRVFSIRNPNEGCPRYYLHLIQNGYDQEIFYAYGQGSSQLGRWRLPTQQFNDFVVPKPPIQEQRQIVDFLDHEIAKIDSLVEEQHHLIELLKEKRQAVISHAVTKGLDPKVPMKDSRVEWLGEVPEQWEMTALKRYWTVTDCKHLTAEFVASGIPVVSIREVQGRFVDLTDAKQTTDEYYTLLIEGSRKPEPGDLIFSRNATVGEVAAVADWHPPFAMGQDVCLLRKLFTDQSTDFLQFVIRSRIITEQLGSIMVGSTIKRVNVEEIRNFIVPIPPTEEQTAIANFLNRETTRADALIAHAETVITLLNERRSALISAAVTGKIDVRGLVPRQEEKAA